MTYTEIVNGEHQAYLYSGSGAGLTNIARNAIVAGTANQIIVNDNDGNITSTSTILPAQGGTGIDTAGLTGYLKVVNGAWSTDGQLGTVAVTTALGGTGIDSSALTGIPKIASGTWTAGLIANADISGSAAIDRAKLVAGTANHVVINGGGGVLASEATLATSRGGTGFNSAAQSGVAKIQSGTWSASSLVDGDISASAAIGRSKVAVGAANHVIVNTGSGGLSSEAFLDTSRGGTGINSSAATGVAKVANGSWSVATIVNADINSSAAIARSKIATSTPGNVVVNASDGTLSSEAYLSVARGGTGTDLSGVGTTPFILTATNGAVQYSLAYSATATANALVQRNSGGGIVVNDAVINGPLTVSANSTLVRTLTSTLVTAGNTSTPILTFTCSAGNNGGYGRAVCHLVYANRNGSTLNTGSRTFSFRFGIIGAAMAVAAISNTVVENDLAFMGTGVSVSASGANAIVTVSGVASTNITWNMKTEIISASLQ